MFLPSRYTPQRKWPILFCFDPAARGGLPIELFRAAAERDGFIIASANRFRSGEEIDLALGTMSDIWNDAMTRYSVDLDRVVAAGFSGGGRICWLLSRATKDVPLAGIIEVGAGLPSGDFLDAGAPPGLVFCGLLGESDFNYYEVRGFDRQLAEKGIPHTLILFGGAHEWPSAEDCGRALDWVQLQGMREGKVARDASFVEDLYRREMAAARAEADTGNVVEAWEAYGRIAEDFDRLRGVDEARAARAGIEKGEGFLATVRHRDEIDAKAEKRLQRDLGILDSIIAAGELPDSIAGLEEDLEIGDLLTEAKSEDRDLRLAALRILEAIRVRAAKPVPQALRERGATRAAERVKALADRIRDEVGARPTTGPAGIPEKPPEPKAVPRGGGKRP